MTDEQVEDLRDDLYALADVALTVVLEARAQTRCPPTETRTTASDQTDKEGKTPSAVELQPKEAEV